MIRWIFSVIPRMYGARCTMLFWFRIILGLIILPVATFIARGQSAPRAERLLAEKSPYLQRHADNLVEWRPWGNAAFAEAKASNKPVFMTVGYSD